MNLQPPRPALQQEADLKDLLAPGSLLQQTQAFNVVSHDQRHVCPVRSKYPYPSIAVLLVVLCCPGVEGQHLLQPVTQSARLFSDSAPDSGAN